LRFSVFRSFCQCASTERAILSMFSGVSMFLVSLTTKSSIDLSSNEKGWYNQCGDEK